MGVTQINKALGNIIPIFDVALAATYDESKKERYDLSKYIIEPKFNGLRLITIITYNNSTNELDIKSWIKAQHEKWIFKGCIDSQMLDLLEQRYAIYTAEGGNSWAKKLMDELRALPTVTVVSLSDIHSEQ
jgi:hypothetical protein